MVAVVVIVHGDRSKHFASWVLPANDWLRWIGDGFELTM